MITDYLTVAKKLNDYAKQKSETKVIPLPNEVFYNDEKCYEITSDSALNNLGSDEDKRFYTLLSQTFTNKDKYELLFVEFISTPQVEAISGAKEKLVIQFDRLKETYDEVYLKEKEKMKSDSEQGLFNELKTFKLEDSVNRRLKYETQPLDSNDSLSKDKKTQITQIYGQTNWDNKKNTFDGKVKLN